MKVFFIIIKVAVAISYSFSIATADSTHEDDNNNNNINNNNPNYYGVDISFPIHHNAVSTNYPWLPHNVDPINNPTPKEYEGMPIQTLGNRQAFYDEFLQGCKDYYTHHSKKSKKNKSQLCVQTELDRVAMSKRQPPSMQNYTDIGFKKVRLPEPLWKILSNFWEKNKDDRVLEKWFDGNTYTNHWSSPTYMVSVENTSLRGGGNALKQAIWDEARSTIEEWTGEELTQCSLYGIRVYTEGAILAPHVDRLPLVSSAIVNVAQDVDEPWPIEVYGHDGRAYNVTMEPGDMVLYESHSLLHGRPFPLKGRYFANIFIHFEPTGHTLRHHQKMNGNTSTNSTNTRSDQVEDDVKRVQRRREAGHENVAPSGLPVYIREGSDEAKRWQLRHSDNNRSAKPRSFQTGSTAAHEAAQKGDVESLKEIVEIMEDYVHKKDSNGWTPLHEGSRSGYTEIVEILLEKGANINEKTNTGETALYLAEETHGESHRIVQFLRDMGGISLGPEL